MSSLPPHTTKAHSDTSRTAMTDDVPSATSTNPKTFVTPTLKLTSSPYQIEPFQFKSGILTGGSHDGADEIFEAVRGKIYNTPIGGRQGQRMCSALLRRAVREATKKLAREGKRFEVPLKIYIYEARDTTDGTWCKGTVTAFDGQSACGMGLSLHNIEELSLTDSKAISKAFSNISTQDPPPESDYHTIGLGTQVTPTTVSCDKRPTVTGSNTRLSTSGRIQKPCSNTRPSTQFDRRRFIANQTKGRDQKPRGRQP